MAKPKKIQLHSINFQAWNIRGAINFTAFSPNNILAGDAWHNIAEVNVEVNDLTIRPQDTVVAIIDNPGPLNETNLAAGKWKVLRNLSDDILDWIEQQLYTAPSANLTGSITLEKGFSSAPYGAKFTWNVTAGTNPIITSELQKREGAGSWTKVKDLTGNSGSETIDITIDTDTQVRVMVSSKAGESIYSPSCFVKFQFKTGYRVGGGDIVLNDAFMKDGTMGFDTDAYRSFTANAAAGEHIYYYVPKLFVTSPYMNPPYFYVGGFEGGFNVASQTAAYVFGDGTTVDYVVYKSTNSGLGSTNVTVQAN
ncbi:MAG: hypothetical protein RBT65_12055 [Methanolobus sp.]|nr:hypothetical protein [Methanolobus sp.]